MDKQRTARIIAIMNMVNQSGEDRNDCSEQQLNTIANGEVTKKNHEYALRESAKKTYCEENDKEVDEDFSPDVSEYLPSPERLMSLRKRSKSLSSLGGDTEYLVTASQDLSRTPSTISNISFFLNQSDFIASPSGIIDARKFSVTPKSHGDGTTGLTLTPMASENNNTGPLNRESRTHSRRRCLTYTTIFEEANNQNAPSSPTGTICIQQGNKVSIPSSSGEVSVDNQSFVPQSHNVKDFCDLDETLEPENISNSLLADSTLVGDANMSSNPNDRNIVNLSQSGVDENIDVSYHQSPNENHPIRSNLVIAEQLPRLETAAASLEHETLTSQKKLTRKRSRNESENQDQKSKKLKNSGEAYKGCRSKKEFEKKKVKAECKCKKKCGEHIAQEQREEIMLKYYRLGDHERQWQYIANHTTAEDVKRITLARKNNRTQTIKYYLQSDTEKLQVCKTFFINTLCISHQTVYTALEKNKSNEGLNDKRGHHDNRPRKMNIETQQNIIQHIKLFPTIESHYVRKDTDRQYLSELLNISKMYRLYQIWFREENFNCPMASKRQYVTIFNTKFNYSFFKPKKDQCAICTLYQQADPTRKEALQEKYDRHQRNKERVRQIKKGEKETVDPTNTTIGIFDLEKVLSIPQSQVGIFHYKRKYPIYNFTVFDATRLKGYCYVWHYQIAKRGAVEIGSCLWQFFLNEKERGIVNLSLYSDGCGGQNKNRFIFALYTFAAQKLQMNITHRFFETGHGQSEGDSMHSNIERELKHRVVYTPEQMYGIILNAKVNSEKYNVKEMLQSEFYDIKELINDRNWVKDEEGQKVAWSKVMEVSVLHSRASILRFKYDFDAEYSQLNTELQHRITPRSKRGTRQTATNTPSSATERQLQIAYAEPLPLSKALHGDLMGLCKIEAIPSYYHAFYDSLTFVHTISDNSSRDRHNDCDNDQEE